MNFVFDIGNVLVTYKPYTYIEGLFPGSPFVKELAAAIFLGKEWLDLDRGTLTFGEACEILCKRMPELDAEIRLAFKNVNNLYSPITETTDLLPKIREQGHKIYYLSNISFDARDYLLQNYRFFDLFDGGVFSCDVRLLKPEEEIYRHLLEKHSLTPEECIFFDDVEANAKAAEKLGIRGVTFTGAGCVIENMA
ncbi:MAG: HAD family phosphatase [Oscillospiraceae bacterium]|nr:HAD family phosphatase [Oscillospiraceae bacterium]